MSDEDKVLRYTGENIPIRVLYFENTVLKEVISANVRVDFADSLQLIFSRVALAHFSDGMF